MWRSAAGVTRGVDPAWWQGFADPVLTALVERALANNVDIAIAASRVEGARAQFRFAEAERLPDIGLAAGGQRDRHVNAFGQAVEENASQGEMGISYDLDLFGRLRSSADAARAGLLANEAARDNVRLAVAASTAQGYIQLRALDARLEVLKDTLAARSEALKLASRRTGAGYSPAIELSQAQAEYDVAAQLIPATELAIRRQEDGLSLLLGTNPAAILRGKSLDQLMLPTPAAMLPSALLRRRPDIMVAEEQLVATDHSLDAARAAFLPDIQLNGAGGYVASSLLASNPIGIFSLGASILAPIFDGGRLKARERGVAAQRDEAAFAYRKTALNAFREVEDALAAIALNDRQEQDVAHQRRAAADLLALATNRYREGYSPYLEQVDAERGLLGANLALVQIRAERLGAAVTLYQALGGGWSDATNSK
jgi:NodT family efflux transporter outer membrane factor (OMF) lipoprotein